MSLMVSLVSMASCNEDFLETEPLTEISETALWQYYYRSPHE